MAYANKYRVVAVSHQSEPGDYVIENYIWIKEDGYSGSVTELKGRFDSFKLNRDFANLEQNILGINVEFAIVDTEADYFTLMELITATERQFQIVVEVWINKIKQLTAFEGYINVDANERGYIQYQEIRLVASSYLNKLKYYYPPLLDTVSGLSFIDVIIDMLNEIGSTYKIRVHSTLCPEEDYGVQSLVEGGPGFSGFDKAGFDTRLYWKNNVERNDSFTVLKSILTIMNCYIYWWDGYWYIEHYDNIWTTASSKWWVEYDPANSYDPFNMGVWREETGISIADVHDLRFIERSQKLGTVPGNRQVVVKLNEKKQDNLVQMPMRPNLIYTSIPAPTLDSLLQWALYREAPVPGQITWGNIDQKYKDIDISITKYYADPTQFPSDSELADDFAHGIYKDFEITINDGAQLTISWKYNPGDDVAAWVLGGGDGVEYIQYWAVRVLDVPGYGNVMISDSSNSKDGDFGWLLITYGYGDQNVLNEMQRVTQDAFDQDTHTYTFSATIPLQEINTQKNSGSLFYGQIEHQVVPITIPFSGTWKMQLIIGEVTRKINVNRRPLKDARYGDIKVSLTDEIDPPANYIEGTINTSFLDKKEISVDLADISDVIYLNSIKRGGTVDVPFTDRTVLWRSKLSGDTARSIIDRLLINKFRFHNVTRLQIRGNVFDSLNMYRPMQLYQDSKQSNKKFVLMGYSFKFGIGVYDVILLEYDNETDVTLTDV